MMATKKALTPEEMLQQAKNSYSEERLNWEFIYKFGCRDPFWPDGTNLNLIRNHCIFYRQQMAAICKEYSLPIPETLPLPDEVDNDYMAPYGLFPNRLVNREPGKPFQYSLELF